MSVFTALMVGDMHVRPDDLADCENLMEGLLETLEACPQVAEIWFLGDLFHTHAWIHVDVQAFWLKWLRTLSELALVNVVIGNHDQAPSGNHAVQWVKETSLEVTVFDEASLHPGFAVVPYMRKEDFLQATEELKGPSSILICHQTFAGAQFENGFYAPEGVSPDAISFANVISGHIHEPQILKGANSTIYYVGSPRWISLNDANSERFIHLVSISSEGDLVEIEKIPTGQWCKRILRVEVTPESTWTERTLDLKVVGEGDEYHFDLRGPKVWCEEAAALYSRYGKVRTFPEQAHVVHVRESEGVFQAFRKFVDSYVPLNATPVAQLKTMVEERFSG